MVTNAAEAKQFIGDTACWMTLLRFCAGVSALALACDLALAQPFSAPPPPPQRPAWLDARPNNEPATAPPAALPSASSGPARTPPPQPVAPPFDRQAFRACGTEWHALQQAGAAGGRIWRDFAAECVPRHTMPR